MLLKRWITAECYDQKETDICEKLKYLPNLIDVNQQIADTLRKIGTYTQNEVEEGFDVEE